MDYRMVEKEETQVIGVYGSIDEGIWDKVKQDGTLSELEQMGGGPITLGLCFGDDDLGRNTYMVAVKSKAEDARKYEKYIIPESSWLVFESKGPVKPALTDTWTYIYGEFLPSGSYRQNRYIPTIEKFFGTDTESEDYLAEIWIPVLK